jgi:hypothetical protein
VWFYHSEGDKFNGGGGATVLAVLLSLTFENSDARLQRYDDIVEELDQSDDGFLALVLYLRYVLTA